MWHFSPRWSWSGSGLHVMHQAHRLQVWHPSSSSLYLDFCSMKAFTKQLILWTPKLLLPSKLNQLLPSCCLPRLSLLIQMKILQRNDVFLLSFSFSGNQSNAFYRYRQCSIYGQITSIFYPQVEKNHMYVTCCKLISWLLWFSRLELQTILFILIKVCNSKVHK